MGGSPNHALVQASEVSVVGRGRIATTAGQAYDAAYHSDIRVPPARPGSLGEYRATVRPRNGGCHYGTIAPRRIIAEIAVCPRRVRFDWAQDERSLERAQGHREPCPLRGGESRATLMFASWGRPLNSCTSVMIESLLDFSSPRQKLKVLLRRGVFGVSRRWAVRHFEPAGQVRRQIQIHAEQT